MNFIMKKYLLFFILYSLHATSGNAQTISQIIQSHFNGSYENYSQYYMKDDKIGATLPPDKFASNGFFKFDFNHGDFSAGFQLESYLPSTLGFFPIPADNKSKIVNKYFKYTQKKFSIQVGDFYEQFGNGLIFRSYENRQIGINNAIEGFKATAEPTSFLKTKFIYGKPREIFDYANAYVRGADAELDLVRLFTKKEDTKITTFSIGQSFIAKYQEYTGPLDNFPKQVNANSTRIDFASNKFTLNAEYATKSKDPHLTNGGSMKKGNAFQCSGDYTMNNLGFSVIFRSISNMEFKADRDQEYLSISPLNYLPSITKQHDNLTSNIYVYATQIKGETGVQSDLYYKIKPGTTLGGKYGTQIAVNFSYNNALNDSGNVLSFGKEKYSSDCGIDIKKKWNKKLETTLAYQNIFFNGSLQVASHSNVIANLIAASMLYKFANKTSIRFKVEHLFSDNDKKNWAAALTEFSIKSKYTLFASDLYNYGLTKNHYYNIGASVTEKSTRLSVGFGKQRDGLFCVGGVCRFLPASYGFTATLTTNFGY